jgi:hypothetical protein
MQQVPFLLDISDAAFFGALAYLVFYGLTLLAGGFLLLLLVLFTWRAKPTGIVMRWLLVVCVAGILGEAQWYQVHPGTLAGPTYWRHLTVLGIGLTIYLLFWLNRARRDKKN